MAGLVELLLDHPEGDPGWVALAGEHPGEPADRGGAVDPLHRAELAADQDPGGGVLVLLVDLGERLLGDLVGDALAAQLLRERAAGQPLAGLARLDPGAGERRVVDEADLLEPVEQPLPHLLGHALAGQLGGELGAAAGLAGELVEQDLAGHRLVVGLGTERGPVLGRRLGAPAAASGLDRLDQRRPIVRRGPVGQRDAVAGEPGLDAEADVAGGLGRAGSGTARLVLWEERTSRAATVG